MFYSQEMYNEGINNICQDIIEQNRHYDYIIGIVRGGLIPATSISYRLNIPLVTVTVQTRDLSVCDIGNTARLTNVYSCLVVDDIVDSGETLKILLDKWDRGGIHTACLVYNEGQTDIVPTYYHEKINKQIDPAWVTFWWDK